MGCFWVINIIILLRIIFTLKIIFTKNIKYILSSIYYTSIFFFLIIMELLSLVYTHLNNSKLVVNILISIRQNDEENYLLNIFIVEKYRGGSRLKNKSLHLHTKHEFTIARVVKNQQFSRIWKRDLYYKIIMFKILKNEG